MISIRLGVTSILMGFTWSCGLSASVLWLGYEQSSLPKQGDVKGRGYDLVAEGKRYVTYSSEVTFSPEFAVRGYLDQNGDTKTIGYGIHLKASDYGLEWQRGWQNGALTMSGSNPLIGAQPMEVGYRSSMMSVSLFEYKPDTEGLEVGLVYYRRLWPTTVKAEGATSSNQYLDDVRWLDTRTKYEIYGFHLRYDGLRKAMNTLVATGKSGSVADWYMSFSHIQGIGWIRLSNDVQVPGTAHQFKGDDQWWGILALEARYQLGLAYIKAGSGWALSLDASAIADLSFPLGLHKNIFSSSAKIPQQKRFSAGWLARASFSF